MGFPVDCKSLGMRKYERRMKLLNFLENIYGIGQPLHTRYEGRKGQGTKKKPKPEGLASEEKELSP